MQASGAAARALAAVRKAFEQATADIADDPDRRASVVAASRLADGLRDIFEDSTAFREELVVAIVDGEHMTRQELADLLGLTRRRINQLYRAGGGQG